MWNGVYIGLGCNRPAAVYASAIGTPGLLPNAAIVVDHLQLVGLTNEARTKVRRHRTWDLGDRCGRRANPEWTNRRRLLRSAWFAKEELLTLLSAVRCGCPRT